MARELRVELQVFKAVVLADAGLTTLESLDFWHAWVGSAFFLAAKTAFNVFFTLEALTRVITYTPLREACRSAILWLDVLTVLPFWVRLRLTAP